MFARKLNAHNVFGSILGGALVFGALPAFGPTPAAAQTFQFSTTSRIDRSDERVSDRDVEALIKTLNLDADQEALVRALYDGHRSAWKDASAEHRVQMQALFESNRQTSDWGSFRKNMREVQKQWAATSDALESDFLESVKSIASDQQLTNWPRFERDRRRRTLLATQSELSGEGVDLVDVAESIDLAPETIDQIQPVSNVYGEEIDMAIADRTRAIDALEKASAPDPDGDLGSVDFEAVKNLQTRLHDKRVAVRDLNERYAALFCGQLSADEAQQFMTAYKLRSFPRVYRPTAADRYINTVESLGILDEEQTRALGSINDDYLRQVGGINDQLAQLIRQEEDENEDSEMFFGGGGLDLLPPPPPAAQTQGQPGDESTSIGVFIVAAPDGGGGGGSGPVRGQVIQTTAAPMAIAFPTAEAEDDSPRGKLSKVKRELVNRTIDAVAALLTPEQLALAPKPDEIQQLAPEERMRRQVEQALENAVFEATGDGGQNITFTIEPSTEGSKP